MAQKQETQSKILEVIEFYDIEQAKQVVSLAEMNHIRLLIALVLAVVSTIFTVIGLLEITIEPGLLFNCAIVLAILAYLIGGGIGKVIKIAWRIAQFGWFIVPVFPVDLFFGILFFLFSAYILLFVPIIFVGMNYIQHKKTLASARSYLAQCGYVTSSEQE